MLIARWVFDPAPVLQVRIDADPSAALERRHIVNEIASSVEHHRRELLLHCYRMLAEIITQSIGRTRGGSS